MLPGGENLTRDGNPRIRKRPYRATKKKPLRKNAWGKYTGNMLLSRACAARVIENIEHGGDRDDAIAAAGVTRQTFQRWESKAAQGIQPYKSFFDDLYEAVAKQKMEYVKKAHKIAMDGHGDLDALKFMVQHKWPQQFVITKKLEVTHEDANTPTPTELQDITALLRSGVTTASLPSSTTELTEAEYEEISDDDIDGDAYSEEDSGGGESESDSLSEVTEEHEIPPD